MARVWYHVFPLGAVGAPRVNDPEAPVVPRLERLRAWLPHIADLGATTLLLGPVFESSTHGYDTIDHVRVDRRLGDEEDLVRLVAQARDLGIGVVLDGVFNHVGRDHPRFRRLLAEGPDSAAARWFHVYPNPSTPDGFTYEMFEGHAALVTLRHDEPEVLDHAVAVACHWLDRGVAGWRLDAAYAVPHRFWRSFTERVRARHPDAVLVGEVIHGDYADFASHTGIDLVTQYELWKAIWSSLNDANPHELAWALERHEQFCHAFTPLTFVGNHDVTRIASRLDDPAQLPLALAVLFTVPGVPCVYAGDEWGTTGVKRDEAGGDDDVRPPLPDAAPTGTDGVGRLDGPAASVLALHRDLIAARHRDPWLETGRLDVVEVTQHRLVFRVSDVDDGRSRTVALDYGGTSVAVS
ncbi:MAG: alpha-amylase family glycosyl hydrolase [Acidimicrobiales bacterium]|jgi:cyclomaltodextrinase|nr:alpha-amylase family glycosyl hydrolase [Acidimicrobiales bacterium]